MRFGASVTENRRQGLTCAGEYGIKSKNNYGEDIIMETKHIITLETRDLCASAKNGGCGECQTSCQSACKTSCGIANQQCENENR